jgi:hypothetical protein
MRNGWGLSWNPVEIILIMKGGGGGGRRKQLGSSETKEWRETEQNSGSLECHMLSSLYIHSLIN